MLPIGSKIGILGGGQLGRMLSVAAAQLGFKCHVYEPEKNPPAGETSTNLTTASYTDYGALEKFAKSVDIVTFEFENIPSKTLRVLYLCFWHTQLLFFCNLLHLLYLPQLNL